MLRILLCCGGGFSSSAITVRMQNEIKGRGLEDQYSIDFYPLGVAGEQGKRIKNLIINSFHEKCQLKGTFFVIISTKLFTCTSIYVII